LEMAEQGPQGGRAALHYPNFVYYEAARFCIVVSLEMQSVAVGWQVYQLTHRALDLGLVGLAQFLPGILLFLITGHAADRLERRRLLTTCYAGFALCSALLLMLTMQRAPSVAFIYVVLVFLGVVRSFNGPVSRALLPQLVPEEHFPNAVTWNATTLQTATILGPALGGVVYAIFHGPACVYLLAVISAIVAGIFTLRLTVRTAQRSSQPNSWRTFLAGLGFIWNHKVILGSISLDLFAVLLGGAVALLPIYASEILKTGAWGLGLLRSSPGIGAAVMAILLAHYPLRRRAGATMLWCVVGFGIFTIVFGLSRNLILSMIALLLVGATDMVSVVVRATVVQIATPEEMQGRVNAVDLVFIGASNEFGEFESGLTAHWFGVVPAVILGGIGAIVVTGLWAWMFPELRRANKLTDV
jgi:MFS family permease